MRRGGLLLLSPPVSSPTRVLRRALEDALETRAASSILFEALSDAGKRIPQTLEEVLEVVRGPLRGVLTRRLGEHQGLALVMRIEAELVPAGGELATMELSLDELAAETRREDATAAFPTADRAVPVLIVAAGRAFEHRLAVALGERRAAPTTVTGHDGLRHALSGEPPSIFVVDASDLPAIDPSRVIAAAAAFPATTTCVLWGPRLPYGRRFTAAMAGSARSWLTLELREGIEPLLDLVRSRRTHRRA